MSRSDSPARPSVFYRLGTAAARHPRRFLTAWGGLLIGAALVLLTVPSALTNASFAVPGADSDQATTLLQDRFPQALAEQDLLVFHSDRLTVQC